ncbi:MAG: hypothetical protein M0P94_01660 [Candidatus Absconditabacterales bacterium]|nr:hypothetical protein [Candidatus Absconditabacterales bacterium]
MKTLKETVDYIHNYIVEYEKGGDVIEKDVLYDMIEEELLDVVEGVLTEEDMKNWINSKDDTFLDKLLNERLEDYPGLLESIKNDILNEYILEE